MSMRVHDLSLDAVRTMLPVDLTTVDEEPPSPIGTFDFNGCTAGIASFVGTPPWERHDGGDELLLVLAGESRLTVRCADGDEDRTLRPGDLVIVPRACWHSNATSTGVTLLFLTPRTDNQYSSAEPRRS
jgi:mannose-6-phosphate isomerase-like protein (cupin superfamily)